jgi:hypothetical protein
MSNSFILSGDGIQVVSLTANNIGISYTPKQILSGNLLNFSIFGSVFKIDEVYNNSQFILNERRTPQNSSSTFFTFLSTLDYPVHVYRSPAIDKERIRIKLYGYY